MIKSSEHGSHTPAWWRKLPAVLMALAMCLPAVSEAQDRARLPYDMAFQYLQLFESLGHLQLISPAMIIASTDPSVKPEDISFRILVNGEWLTFKPGADGVIVLPFRETWTAQSLVLGSAQPRGTLMWESGFQARGLASESVAYRDVLLLVDQFSEALSAVAALQDSPAPDILGLTIQMPAGAGMTIQSAKRPKIITPNSAGIIILKHNPSLWEENPSIVFDSLPLGIMPLQ